MESREHSLTKQSARLTRFAYFRREVSLLAPQQREEKEKAIKAVRARAHAGFISFIRPVFGASLRTFDASLSSVNTTFLSVSVLARARSRNAVVALPTRQQGRSTD